MLKKLALVSVGAALIAGAVWWTSAKPGQTTLGTSALALMATPAMADTTAPAADATKLPDVPEMSIGNPDAKVTVTEYLSFTCPHCEEFHATVWKDIKKNYVDTNKIKFTVREVYFDKYGLWAGMMAHCGGPLRYFGIVDILFDTQQKWAASQDPNAVVASLRQIGKTAGMTDAQLDQCMNDGAMAQALVEKYQKDSAADKIEGTPSFVVDGTTYKNMGYDEFSKLLDAELAKNP